ncbi:MAG: erythromycin esterase family protein, partial [Persicimonas sp.]
MVGKQTPESLVAEHAHRLTGAPDEFDALVDSLADADVVLLGEASHGTEEFYRVRAAISRRLLAEHGFGAVLLEADWPDAYRVNRFIKHDGEDPTPAHALSDFERFPRWMWRNHAVANLIGWMRRENAQRAEVEQFGLYGFDLYSLHRSMNAVVDYLDELDPSAALRARQRYACFDHFGDNARTYGQTAGTSAEDCESEVVEQLVELERQRGRALASDGLMAEDEFFFAEQNARVVKNAEEYYRMMYRGRASSWNVRDEHMAETITALINHLRGGDRPARAIVWAHNSHLGDARATSMRQRGEI